MKFINIIFRERFSAVDFMLGTAGACAFGMHRVMEAGLLFGSLFIISLIHGFVIGFRKGISR